MPRLAKSPLAEHTDALENFIHAKSTIGGNHDNKPMCYVPNIVDESANEVRHNSNNDPEKLQSKSGAMLVR